MHLTFTLPTAIAPLTFQSESASVSNRILLPSPRSPAPSRASLRFHPDLPPPQRTARAEPKLVYPSPPADSWIAVSLQLMNQAFRLSRCHPPRHVNRDFALNRIGNREVLRSPPDTAFHVPRPRSLCPRARTAPAAGSAARCTSTQTQTAPGTAP